MIDAVSSSPSTLLAGLSDVTAASYAQKTVQERNAFDMQIAQVLSSIMSSTLGTSSGDDESGGGLNVGASMMNVQAQMLSLLPGTSASASVTNGLTGDTDQPQSGGSIIG